MTRGLPSPADRPDLYDGYDGGDRPAGWVNPVQRPERLQARIENTMNPIPLKSETFSPVAHRADSHSIRYEFRHLVNAGVLKLAQYETFVALVDTAGSVNGAVARLLRGETLA